MQSATWVQLLRQAPVELRQRLMIVTNVGAEIAIQDIVQMADEYLVLRGRLAGGNDAGRLFLVPFDQISYVNSQDELREERIRAVFCSGSTAAAAVRANEPVAAPEPAAVAEAESVAEPSLAAEQPPAAEPVTETPTSTQPQKPAGPVNRAELLQRIRTRSTTGSAFRPLSGS